MAFEIKFLNQPDVVEEGKRSKWGLIRLGDFEERFLSAVYRWNSDDYELQWKRAIGQLLEGANKTALVTSFCHPDEGVTVWWPMYREGTNVFVQNQLLLPESAPNPFTLQEAISRIGPRQSFSEDSGEPISTWQISVADLQAFLRTEN